MRLIALLTLCTVLLGQDAAKPAPTKSPAVVSLPDKDRADFLLVQRDWMAVQKQYEAAFQKEPAVAAYDAKMQQMAKACKEGGAQFDPQKVQCMFAPEAPKTPPK